MCTAGPQYNQAIPKVNLQVSLLASRSVENDSGAIGMVEDRAAIMAVREMSIDLPDTVDIPTKLFVFFMAAHLLQTQA